MIYFLYKRGKLKSITILCQDDTLALDVSQGLADALGVYFADASGIISYTLQDEKAIWNTCGIDYLGSLKRKCLEDIAEYENSIISLDFSLYLGFEDKNKFLSNTHVVYLRLDSTLLEKSLRGRKSLTSEEIALSLRQFSVRDELLKKYSETTLDLNNLGRRTAINRIVKLVCRR